MDRRTEAGLLLTLIPLIWAAGIPSASASAAMRCRGGLVDVGDRKLEVERKCGRPNYRAYVGERSSFVIDAGPLEDWYYDRGGSRLLYVLRFEGSRVADISTEGYGFNARDARRCRANEIYVGMTEYELLAACGEPVSRDITLQRSIYRGEGRHRSYRLIEIQEWAYDLGPGQFLRFVRIDDGRVVEVELGDRGGT